MTEQSSRMAKMGQRLCDAIVGSFLQYLIPTSLWGKVIGVVVALSAWIYALIAGLSWWQMLITFVVILVGSFFGINHTIRLWGWWRGSREAQKPLVRPEMILKPLSNPNGTLILQVAHKGERASLFAKSRILACSKEKGQFPESVYDLAWENDPNLKKEISKAPANLNVGTFEMQYQPHQIGYLRLVRNSGEGLEVHDELRWVLNQRFRNKPFYRICVEVFNDHAAYPYRVELELTPQSTRGPIQFTLI